ncbi:MAG TPA: ATP-binding protein [Acidimicrobiales bacterium]|nr:ATP-binding protein [Acidimicrobiales bacterium]
MDRTDVTLLDDESTSPARDEDGFASFAAAVEQGSSRTAPVPRPAAADEAPAPVPGLSAQAGDGEVTLRETLSRWGTAPLAVLFALNVVDELDRIALTVLAPNLRDAFGLSTSALVGIANLGSVMTLVAAMPVAVLAERRNRARIAAVTGVVWSVFAALTGVVTNAAQLALARVGAGIGKASVEPVHSSLLADAYPVAARGRVFAAHQLANPVAVVLGPLLVGGIVLALPGDGWRAGFLVPAALSLLAAVAAFRLREPARGRFERGHADDAAPTVDVPAVTLAASMRRLLQIQTLRSMYFGLGILGFALFGAGSILSLFLEQHHGLGEGGRALVFAVLGVGGLVGMPIGGTVGDRLFRHDPSWPLFLIGAALPVYGVAQAVAVYLPGVWLTVAALVVAQAFVTTTTPAFRLLFASVTPPAMRSVAFGSIGIFMVVFGGFGGGIVFGAIADATSEQLSLALLGVPTSIAGLVIIGGARTIRADLAAVAADLREERLAAERRRQPQRNLLEIRNLDFHYGPVQILFDVELDVPEGEIFALLGTNGAGKSTLLRAVTGLTPPTRGSIRFDGIDTTYLGAEQLLELGIAQMPGGKATFPGLTVHENLRVGAHTLRHDPARVERRIDEVFDRFPRLRERRDQLAGTLSGGEQQMLALGKAFLTEPRLLCIDELSLGLQPSIVADILDIVREVHARGTTIIIVEQSLNVALSLATTAVFMEKGQVRFTGPARELLERPDLARSVFLDGAQLGGGGAP